MREVIANGEQLCNSLFAHAPPENCYKKFVNDVHLSVFDVTISLSAEPRDAAAHPSDS